MRGREMSEKPEKCCPDEDKEDQAETEAEKTEAGCEKTTKEACGETAEPNCGGKTEADCGGTTSS